MSMATKKHRRQASSQSNAALGATFPPAGVNSGTAVGSQNGGPHSRSLASNIPYANAAGPLAEAELDSVAELDKVAREVLFNPDNLRQLNERVLRRHNEAVVRVLHTVPYAVVYAFSPDSQSWEKCGIEGTLFVVQLLDQSSNAASQHHHQYDQAGHSIQRFAVMILNRRGLENFCVELNDPRDVDVTSEYIMLQGANSMPKDPAAAVLQAGGTLAPAELPSVATTGQQQQQVVKIYGLWIFSDTQSGDGEDGMCMVPSKMGSQSEKQSTMLKATADIVQSCAREAEQSRVALAARAASVAAPTPKLTSFGHTAERTDGAGRVGERPGERPSGGVGIAGGRGTTGPPAAAPSVGAQPVVRQLSLRELFGERR